MPCAGANGNVAAENAVNACIAGTAEKIELVASCGVGIGNNAFADNELMVATHDKRIACCGKGGVFNCYRAVCVDSSVRIIEDDLAAGECKGSINSGSFKIFGKCESINNVDSNVAVYFKRCCCIFEYIIN